MVPEKVAAVEDAMEHYRSIRDERMQLSARETEANDKLVKALEEHNKGKEYVSPDGLGKAEIITEVKKKAKVSKVKSTGDDPEE
jgi:hypothetical protein